MDETNYYYALLLFVSALGGSFFLLWGLYALYKKRRVQKILAQGLGREEKKVLQQLPLYQKLSDEDKKKIENSILLFIHTKEFVGVDIEVTAEIKTVIAFHACILLLHAPLQSCYENLSTILVYSHTVVSKRVRESGGVFVKGEFLLEGESSGDTVVLAWSDAKKDAYHPHNSNVIVHEFAHELDFLDGSADGTPPLPVSKYHEWAKVMFKHFKNLQQATWSERGWRKYRFIGEYAATNEAEFFAVVSERYFENPEMLKKHFRELYEELNSFYGFYTC